MRKTLIDFFNSAISFEYSLPYGVIQRASISTRSDFAYRNVNNDEMSQLIYNGIVDLAFENFKIHVNKLDELQERALMLKIKYDKSNPDYIGYGFFGEVVLNAFMQIKFNTDVLVARGHFYGLIDNSEPHGYDCHHVIYRNNRIELWFGETKFYQNYSEALKKIISKLNNDLSIDFLSKNLLHIIDKEYPLATQNKDVCSFVDDLKKSPLRSFSEDVKKHNIKLIYPALVIFDENTKGFDFSVEKCVSYIEKYIKDNNLVINSGVDYSFFFIFLSVQDTKQIKTQVLEWIKEHKAME